MDPNVGQLIRVADRHILNSANIVMDDLILLTDSSIMERLLQLI